MSKVLVLQNPVQRVVRANICVESWGVVMYVVVRIMGSGLERSYGDTYSTETSAKADFTKKYQSRTEGHPKPIWKTEPV